MADEEIGHAVDEVAGTGDDFDLEEVQVFYDMLSDNSQWPTNI